MKVRFLGTNGWYTTNTGNTPCILIDTETEYIVLDAGNGIHLLDKYITDDNKPIYLFLSHFHLDHISGMHIFYQFRFKQGMTICCYEGGAGLLDEIIRQPFTMALKDLPMEVQVLEIEEGENAGFSFGVEAKVLLHSSKCFGYRFNLDGVTVTYCTDTGSCESALELARGADLLITECALKTGQQTPGWPHLNPELAAAMAKRSGAKRLALTHFDAEIYTSLEERKEAQEKAGEIFPETVAALDGTVIEI